jgi:hypothetical protein
MNQNATSMPTRSARIRATSGLRQFSKATSQMRSSAEAREGINRTAAISADENAFNGKDTIALPSSISGIAAWGYGRARWR